MIIMIIAELSGRRRQSPIVQGEEAQCLGTKDTLSIDTHRSHVYTISVRYTVELDPWISPHFSVIF